MENFKVGHYNDEYTGTTVVLCPKGAITGVDVRGGAPGTRETDLLRSDKSVSEVHAVVLTGGSAFGLDACSGVMEYLSKEGVGFDTGLHRVPIVSGAVLFDLNDKELHYPDKSFGIEACKNAKENNLSSGSIGAGKGATVGKIMGFQHASKGGIGTATLSVGDARLQAIIAVNALGDVYDFHSNKILAGALLPDGGFLDTWKIMLNPPDTLHSLRGKNTTIGVIITDAKLTKLQANTLASLAHNGLAQSIRPVHTAFDGDTLFVMSRGEKTVDINALGVAVVEVVRQAVLNSVCENEN